MLASLNVFCVCVVFFKGLFGKTLLQCKPEDESQKTLDWNQARWNRDTFIVISIQSIAQLATFTKNNPDVTFHFVLRHGPEGS